MPSPSLILQKSRSFGEMLKFVLDLSLAFRWLLLRSVILICGIPWLLIYGFVTYIMTIGKAANDGNTIPFFKLMFLLVEYDPTTIIYFGAIALSAILAIILYIGIVHGIVLVYDATQSREIRVGQVWEVMWANFSILSLTTIYNGGVLVAIGLGDYFLTQVVYEATESIAATLPVHLLTVAVLIIASIPLSLMIMIRLNEHIGYSDAIRRSRLLLTRYWLFTGKIYGTICLSLTAIFVLLWLILQVVLSSFSNSPAVAPVVLILGILMAVTVLAMLFMGLLSQPLQYYNLVALNTEHDSASKILSIGEEA